MIVLVVLMIAGLFAWGYFSPANNTASVQGASENKTQSGLVAATNLHDFGVISMKDGNVSQEFAIDNPTDKPITIKTILTSCMCTTAFLSTSGGEMKGPFGMAGMGYVPPANETLYPGESRILKVVYDPNAHGPAGVGAIDRFIEITDSNGSAMQFEIKATVTP